MSHSSARQVTNRQQFMGRINNLYWEFRLGISTRGIVDVNHEDSAYYSTARYATVWKILNELALGPADTFIDIGCGKGRVLCCAARYPCRQVIGVDLSAELCACARVNADRLRGRKAAIAVHEGYADAFDYGDVTVCYLFSPFGPATLDVVLNRIRQDVDGRGLRMAFHSINAGQEEVLARQEWLERYKLWTPESHGVKHPVAFYRTN